MSDQIRIKVRKLLALASDPAATDNERAVAMSKAQALIEQYNIEIGEQDDFETSIKVERGDIFVDGMKLPYHRVIGSAVATLYGCRHFIYKRQGGHAYWGMRHQIEAAEETFLWIVAQIEDLYRQALKAFDGKLTKTQRAELRASFKDAAALRVAHRIYEILNSRKSHSTALVVVDTVKAKIDEMMTADGLKMAKPLALRDGFGKGAGYNAGGLVQIQKGFEKAHKPVMIEGK